MSSSQPSEPPDSLKNKTLRIMPVGDSITTGWHPFENSYRGDLLSLLGVDTSSSTNPDREVYDATVSPDDADPTIAFSNDASTAPQTAHHEHDANPQTAHAPDARRSHSNNVTMLGPTLFGSLRPPSLNRMDALMGRTILQTLNSLRTTLPLWNPDFLLLHTGTNDIAPHLDPPDGLPERVDEILQFVTEYSSAQLAQGTGERSVVVLVGLIIPCAFRDGQLREFNGKVRELVERRQGMGEKVECVDLFEGFPGDGLRDVAHPNGKGYRWMAERWVEGLERCGGWGWLG